MCSTCFPRSILPADASLPSAGSSGASSPDSTVVSKRYDFLSPIPPRFVAFAWRYLGRTRLSSLLGGRVRRRGLELVTRYLRPGISEETTGSPKFLGNLPCPFAHVLADAGRTARRPRYLALPGRFALGRNRLAPHRVRGHTSRKCGSLFDTTSRRHPYLAAPGRFALSNNSLAPHRVRRHASRQFQSLFDTISRP